MFRSTITGLSLLALGAGTAGAAGDVARGEYLVRGPAGCGNCHTPFGEAGFDMSKELSGRLVEDNPMFTAYSANITPGGEVADWSDAELMRAIREGIRPDGSLIGPPMPFVMYRDLGDDDLASIVAFLRTLPAVVTTVPQSEYRMPLPPAYGPPVESVTAPERGVTVEYGHYLATAVAHCMECHSPMSETGPMIDAEHLGKGGFEFHGPWGSVTAPNITSSEDGLAGYTDDELKTIITQGKRPDGETMMPPMPYGYLAQMTEGDLDAIILYLRSLPPLPDA
ncbi:c-type cytochrome [Salipiger mangrovisoli]|uniref:C-type cytochrome n=1 Tax=Salipiger mangrovisoli TaxID=2865933 RepID=A0ABR9X798_9RHOB|nr:c-type cytochrome [Salipiger mangrovisoli]MBE9639469.1 c-type cytochrome [Salipiger mangrovisoli]